MKEFHSGVFNIPNEDVNWLIISPNRCGRNEFPSKVGHAGCSNLEENANTRGLNSINYSYF